MGALKECCCCKESLPLDMFSKCVGHLYDVQSKCKRCTSVYRKRYYYKHRKKAIKDASKWQRENKESRSKTHSRRDRSLGFSKIIENDWDEPIDWHHINNNDVVPLPRYLHRMCLTGDTKRHRELCNKLIKILYGDEINDKINND
jgi:hypothetical protein